MKTILIFIVLLFTSATLFAQVERSSDLFNTLRSNDSLLFNVGFNTADTSQFEDLLSDNFEMYHDEAGIIPSKRALIASIKNLGKMDYKPRRKLVEGSLEVFQLMKNGILYGAIQTGEHQFYGIEKGKPEYLTSKARFTHVWLLENGKWKLSKALSYDHEQAKK